MHIGIEVLRQPVLVDQAVEVRHGGAPNHIVVAVVLHGHDHYMAQLGCGSLSDAYVGGQNDCDSTEQTPVPKRHCHHLLQVRRRAWASTDLRHRVPLRNQRLWIQRLWIQRAGCPAVSGIYPGQAKRPTANQKKSWDLCNLAWQGFVESTSLARERRVFAFGQEIAFANSSPGLCDCFTYCYQS